MFEKWRIKEHMDVADSTGRHVGTVDSVDDGRIKLTRSDSSDGSHHYLDIDSVESIEDNRVTLKVGTPLPEDRPAESVAMGGQSAFNASSPAANQAAGDDQNYSRNTGSTMPSEDRALFGTSGHGTGMGGSGAGTEN